MQLPLIAIVALLLAVGCTSPSARYAVQHFDAQLRLTPEGQLLVHETWNVRFDAPGATGFERQVPANRYDDVVEIRASMDGAAVPEGEGSPRVRIRRGNVPVVQWTFEPARAAAHVFELRYRITGVIELDGMRARIDWAALAAHDYDIETASISLAAPMSAVRLSQPQLDTPGWKMTPFVEGMLFEKPEIGRAERAVVSAVFLADSMEVPEPVWQANDARRRQLMPAFASAGLFIVVVGAGILWMLQFQFPRKTGGPQPGLARGLVASGLVSIVFGIICGVVVYLTLRQLGPWPMAIPASIVIVGVMLIVAGWRRQT